jgi:hypothetical protein
MCDIPSYHIGKQVILSYLVPCMLRRTPSNVMLCHCQKETLMLPVVIPLIETEDLQPHSIVEDKAFHLNPLKHSGYYTCFHIQMLYICTHNVSVFHTDLRKAEVVYPDCINQLVFITQNSLCFN